MQSGVGHCQSRCTNRTVQPLDRRSVAHSRSINNICSQSDDEVMQGHELRSYYPSTLASTCSTTLLGLMLRPPTQAVHPLQPLDTGHRTGHASWPDRAPPTAILGMASAATHPLHAILKRRASSAGPLLLGIAFHAP
jgi:hypothetical protein